jgi:MFS family permease
MSAPAVFAEPTVRVRPGWTSLLFLANLGLWLAVYAPIQVLLPRQAELLDQANKTVVLSVVMGVGALAALVANPVIGMLSDRTASTWGRRHPWTLLGAVVGLIGLTVLAFAPNIVLMVLGWAITQVGLNGMLAALTSALPDRVPVEQRAEIGGYIGISQMLGTVIGALLVTVLVTGLISGYIACGIVTVAFALLFVLRTPDERLPTELRPTGGMLEGLRHLWISPRQHPDFGWGWATHFLVNLGNALGTLYLLFFLDDVVHYQPDPQDGLLILMAIYGVALIIGAVVFGIASDRSGKRKQYVVLSAIVMALAALLLVVWPTWTSALFAAPLLGLGFGIYWAVALAILTEVLPSAGNRAKDLGVINIANSLPQVAAPVLAGLVLKASAGYGLLFGLSAVVTLAGGVVVTRIKGVR